MIDLAKRAGADPRLLLNRRERRVYDPSLQEASCRVSRDTAVAVAVNVASELGPGDTLVPLTLDT